MTLYGAAITPYPNSGRSYADEILQHEIECGPMQILRSYDGAMPLTWDSVSTSSGSRNPVVPGWRTRASWHSVKPDMLKMSSGELDGWAYDYISSIPVTGQPRMLTIQHEPKGKINAGNFTAAQYVKGLYRFARMARAVGHPDVLVGPCFAAKWDLGGAGNINLIMSSDPIADELPYVCDFWGWDPYHEASKSGDYSATYSPAYYLDEVVDWTNENVGLPIAIGETGYIANPNDVKSRARWLREFVDYAEREDFLCVCYFDASVTNPWYIRLDAAGVSDAFSAKSWGLNYFRALGNDTSE